MSGQSTLVNASLTWTGASGNAYGLYKLNKSWSDASTYAKSVGGYLAKVDSSSENNEIFQKLSAALSASDFANTSANDGGGSAYVWLGGTNSNIPGKWVWSGDGSSFTNGYTNWGRGALGSEPDNFEGIQNSLALGMQNWPSGFSINSGYGNAGQWNDIAGTNSLYFLVEVDAALSTVILVQNIPYKVTTPNLNLVGSAGKDIVSYSASSTSFVINVVGANATVSDKTGALGKETLTNVERLQFIDTMVALDIGSTQTAGSGYMLYKAAFNRTPDSGGLGYWINKMDTGMSYSDVAINFVNSAEFKTAFGGSNPSVNTLVTKLYNNVLNRTPDAGGLAFWQGKLSNEGWTTADVLGFFSTSGENVTNVTPLIANGISYTQFVG